MIRNARLAVFSNGENTKCVSNEPSAAFNPISSNVNREFGFVVMLSVTA
jgi:hypothetical protein